MKDIKQQSLMNDKIDSLQKVQTEQSTVLKDHSKVLAGHTRKLDALRQQTLAVSGNLEGVKEILKVNTTLLKSLATNNKNNRENLIKLNKRVSTTEDRLGIAPPPELTVIE